MIIWIFSPSWIIQNIACWTGISLSLSFFFFHSLSPCLHESVHTCAPVHKQASILCIAVFPYLWVYFVHILMFYCVCTCLERKSVQGLKGCQSPSSRVPDCQWTYVYLCDLLAHQPYMLTVCVPTDSASARRANILMWSLSKDEGAASKKEPWQLLDVVRFKPLVCCCFTTPFLLTKGGLI